MLFTCSPSVEERGGGMFSFSQLSNYLEGSEDFFNSTSNVIAFLVLVPLYLATVDQDAISARVHFCLKKRSLTNETRKNMNKKKISITYNNSKSSNKTTNNLIIIHQMYIPMS